MSICHDCEHNPIDCLKCQINEGNGGPLNILNDIARVRNQFIDKRELYHSAMEESSEFAVECSKMLRGRKVVDNLTVEMSDLMINILGIMHNKGIAFEDLAMVALHKTELRHADQWALLNGQN